MSSSALGNSSPLMTRCPECRADVAMPCRDEGGRTLAPGDYHARRVRQAEGPVKKKETKSVGAELNVPCPGCGAGIAQYCRQPNWTQAADDAAEPGPSIHKPFGVYCKSRTRLLAERMPPARPKPPILRRLAPHGPSPRMVLAFAFGTIFTLLVGLVFRAVAMKRTVEDLDRRSQVTVQHLEMLQQDIEDLRVELNAVADPDGGAFHIEPSR